MTTNLGRATLELSADDGGLVRDVESAGNQLQAKLTNLSKKIGVAFTAMGGAITGALGFAAKGAAEFDTAMREVNTLLGLGSEEFNALKGDVLDLSKSLGVDAVKSTNALYQAISAGVPKENALDFLAISSKAAIAGVTDTETVVDGLTTVINAFKLEFSDAEEVADKMFAAVKGGKTTMDELSQAMFQAAPIASSMGISFEEVLGAVTTLTKQGVPTSVAMTQIRQAMVALQKPNADMKDLLDSVGIVSIPELDEAMVTLREGLAETNAEIQKLTSEGLEEHEEALAKNRAAYTETKARLEELSDEGLAKHTDALEKNRDRQQRASEDLQLLNLRISQFTDETNISTVAAANLRKQRLEDSIQDLNSEYQHMTKNGPKLNKTQERLLTRLEDLDKEFQNLNESGGDQSEKLTTLKRTAAELERSIGDLQRQQEAAAQGGRTITNVMGERGLLGTLEMLRTETGATDAQLAGAVGSVEALGAVMALTGDNAQTAASDLEAVSGATGAMGEAFTIMDEGPGRAMEKAMERLSVLRIEVGDKLLPILATLAEKVGSVIEKVLSWMDANPKLVQVLVPVTAAIGALLLVLGPLLIMLPGIIAAVGLLTAVSFPLILTIGAVVLAIAALVAIGVLLWKNWDTIRAKAEDIWGAIKEFFGKWVEKFTEFWTETWTAIHDFFVDTFTAIKDFITEVWDGITEFFSTKFEALIQLFTDTWNSIADFLKRAWVFITKLFQENWDVILAILFPPVGLAVLIARHWGQIVDTVEEIWDRVRQVVKDAINDLIRQINGFIEKVNNIKIRVPEIKIPFDGTVGGFTVGMPQIPKIPLLATGGIITQETLAVVGDVPEAIIPLNRLDNFASTGGGVHVHFHDAVYGMDDFNARINEAVLTAERRGRQSVLR